MSEARTVITPFATIMATTVEYFLRIHGSYKTWFKSEAIEHLYLSNMWRRTLTPNSENAELMVSESLDEAAFYMVAWYLNEEN